MTQDKAPAAIGIDYGKPGGDHTVAMARNPATGEVCEIPLFVAEYISLLEKALEDCAKDPGSARRIVSLTLPPR